MCVLRSLLVSHGVADVPVLSNFSFCTHCPVKARESVLFLFFLKGGRGILEMTVIWLLGDQFFIDVDVGSCITIYRVMTTLLRFKSPLIFGSKYFWQ